jgi:hypothetical protein
MRSPVRFLRATTIVFIATLSFTPARAFTWGIDGQTGFLIVGSPSGFTVGAQADATHGATVFADFNGRSFTKAGAGSLTVTRSPAFFDTVRIDAGELRYANGVSLNGNPTYHLANDPSAILSFSSDGEAINHESRRIFDPTRRSLRPQRKSHRRRLGRDIFNDPRRHLPIHPRAVDHRPRANRPIRPSRSGDLQLASPVSASLRLPTHPQGEASDLKSHTAPANIAASPSR